MSTRAPDNASGPSPAARHLVRGRPRAVPVLVTGVAVAAIVGFGAREWWAGGAHPALAAVVPVATAPVVRTDLEARQAVAGTLGYQGSYSVASLLAGGVLTWLPAPGNVVRRGQPVFAMSGQPVTLLYGQVPAWRTFEPGMTPGQDVRELQRNLAALGFDPGSSDGVFGWSTLAAIERWQQAGGMPVTGTIPLGGVTFLPGPLRVTAAPESLGAVVSAGTTVISGTSMTPGVMVSLAVGGPAVRAGDTVSVTLPDGSTTVPGTVTAVGRVATTPGTAQSGSGGTGSGATGNGGGGTAGGAGGTSGAVIPVVITLRAAGLPAGLDQAPVQVAITQQRDDNVLAVPVTALLATPGGGYAIRVAGPHGPLIPVTTGLFDDASGLVAVAGQGLRPGLTVTVAQG
jgi:peptidoglycan hydrolase-like protein with peptidoglycan-binding domain/type IV secretory pathway TrbD component